MIAFILQAVSIFILLVIKKIGYAGIFFLMVLESVNIPIPSEVIMTFSGFLVQKSIFSFWLVVLVGVLGNMAGSLVSYYLALAFIKNGWYERYRVLKIIINEHSLKTGEEWFRKYGKSSIFFSRMLPVVRTFISFPAGLSRMNLLDFSILSVAGSLIWSTFLTWLGFVLGENWSMLRVYFEKFDYLILFLIAVSVAIWIWNRFKSAEVDIITDNR